MKSSTKSRGRGQGQRGANERLFERIYNDVKGVLRAFFKKNVLEREEIRDLVEAIEKKDNTRIKGFEAVFE